MSTHADDGWEMPLGRVRRFEKDLKSRTAVRFHLEDDAQVVLLLVNSQRAGTWYTRPRPSAVGCGVHSGKRGRGLGSISEEAKASSLRV